MIGDAFEFRHQGAQPDRALRRFNSQRRFSSHGEGVSISDGAVARGSACEHARSIEIGACHQTFDALVDVAEPLFQAHNSFAARSELKETRFDDAGVHRADADLMQAFAFSRQEPIRRRRRFHSFRTS